jgi:hypothetical protein
LAIFDIEDTRTLRYLERGRCSQCKQKVIMIHTENEFYCRFCDLKFCFETDYDVNAEFERV